MQTDIHATSEPERADEMVMQEPAVARARTEQRDPNRVLAWLLAALGGPLALDRFYVGSPRLIQLAAPIAWGASILVAPRWGHRRVWVSAAAISVALWIAGVASLRARLRTGRRLAAAAAQASLDQERIDIEVRGVPAG